MTFSASTELALCLGRNIGPTEGVTDADVAEFIDLVAMRLPCFSVAEGVGYWQGTRERNVTISTIVEDDDLAATEAILQGLAERYAEIHSQDCVLVTSRPVGAQFVSAPVRVPA